jgi:uncharacterized protein
VQYTATPFGYIMVLDPGEELITSLIRIARHEDIDGAALAGIGTVRDVELGFYHLRSPDDGGYERHVFDEPLAACSLTGTISLVDGEPFPHVHGVFGRPDCTTLGGHVFGAVCHVTVEVTLYLAAAALERAAVAHCDLKLMQLEAQP